MEASRSKSFFQDIKSRELNGFRVRKRPYVDESASSISESGAISVEHNGEETPPMAVSFCRTSKNSNIFALTDEDGYLSLFDTSRSLPSFSSHRGNTEKARLSEWVAHENAIFDVCWIKEDTNILTAAGDQTVKVWDAQEKKCTGVLTGHTGSVKSVCPHPTNSDILVSGSRDGSFALWDLRCSITSTSTSSEASIASTTMVKGAHCSPHAKRVRRGKAASMSITSVLYLKDEVSIATAGAVDSIVKFWDVRNLKTQATQACPYPTSPNARERRLHGISSLSQDSNGIFLAASCMDSRIYLYYVLQLEKGPMRSFTGSRIDSFFVKSAISPDAAHILSGSSDGNARLWQVNKPETDPIVINGHDGEVTAVDWCTSEVGKMATCSDDFTVRTWNMQISCCSTARSPSSVRRRVMAMPGEECRQLRMNDKKMSLERSPGNHHNSQQLSDETISHEPIRIPTLGTPEAQKKKFSLCPDSKEAFDKTPEAAVKSPSSVLNPPSSLKRTIRDYFLGA